ncbi:DUF2061 domain-containing protein [Pseudanabaena sp. UWO310]|uniref:DUF2061 domain-containing protein n=1 Tax=Pseudanabaena sp. UWO310 TaxID=2480795 RepID=UPI001161042C|nr:DUF2061 domain-containing protein [Pseudanabaena sp. UWO310]TYQ23577.1 DUF2061 domain-containing protein [Pseudanabaena sp. UWO310]
MAQSILLRRSLVKTFTYRILIMCLDFTTIYILTGTTKVAIGFMIVSNIYTTIAYFLDELFWVKIKWGIERKIPNINLKNE